MKKDIVIPPLGDSVTEATVGRILTPPGTQVKLDQELIEIETDKVNQVLYAPQGGAVSFSIEAGDVVKVGQIIGFVDAAAAGISSPAPVVTQAPPAVAATLKPAPAPAPSPVQAGGVRHMQDTFIKELSEKPAAPAPAPIAALPTPASGSGETRRPMPRIRKVIAKRLVDVQNTTAMLTTFNEVDMSAIMKLRDQYKDKFSEKHGTRLGFLSFFVKAAVKALQAIPDINSYIDGDDIVHRDYYDIAVAVGTDKGLVVPVLRGCDKLSFAGIEKGVADLAKKAKDGKLAIEDMQGGGFTITNGGVYGSLLSTPILNSPQSGILGMHNIVKRAVVVNDQIVIRPMMYLALSYDHRIVDGKEAVTFLVNIKDSLEDPSRLMLDL